MKRNSRIGAQRSAAKLSGINNNFLPALSSPGRFKDNFNNYIFHPLVARKCHWYPERLVVQSIEREAAD